MTDDRNYDAPGATEPNPPSNSAFSRQTTAIQESFAALGGIGVSDLQQLKPLLPDLESQDIIPAKETLRKIFLGSVPWGESYKYIKSDLASVSFSAHEQAEITEADRRGEELQAAIQEDIKAGMFPWLAHAQHNERNVNNPYLIGFYQMPDGKIKPLYGPKYFSSKRQLGDSFLASEFQIQAKVVSLLEGEYEKIEDAQILKTEYWDLLPETLRMHLESGEILITTGEDVYDLPQEQLDAVVQSQNLPTELIAAIDSRLTKATQVDGNDTYHLLFYGGSKEGRTGVLMHNENGEMKPVIITIGDKEFVVEMKGCGGREGGFEEHQWRTERYIVTGAVEKEQAVTEFYRLQDDQTEDAPKAAGSITFKRNGADQGYIVRLTPSTVRASYTNNECYPPIDQPEYVERTLSLYTTLLADNLFTEKPMILDRSSHTENILLWGSDRAVFTDFSDHALLADAQYPYEHADTYITPRHMLELYVRMAQEIPGFSVEHNLQQYFRNLNAAFLNHDIDLQIDSSYSFDQAAEKIWDQCLAYQVFSARKKAGYIAEGVIDHDLSQGYRFHGYTKSLARENQASFVGRYHTRVNDVINAARLVTDTLPNDSNASRFAHWVKHIENGDIMTALTSMDGVYKSLEEVFPHLSSEQKLLLYDAYSYFRGLRESVVVPIQNYFTHELDVVTTAQESCPEYEREVLEEANEELVKKQAELAGVINADPASLFTKITDRDELKKLLALGYYGH